MLYQSLFDNFVKKVVLVCALGVTLSTSAEDIRDSGSIPTLGGSACNLIYSPSDATWQINRFALDENLNESTTLFSTQSNASIQSVACDITGENAYFAYKMSELDDFDIYQLALDQEGASPTPLTNNTVDDTNVSISEDGTVIAWQTELDDGRQAVEIQENLANGSIETRTLSSANHYLQPSLSQNGEWLSLVQRRTGSDLVFKYHLEDAAFTRLSTVPRRKGAYNPSINNDGDKVAWVEGKGKNVLILHTAGESPARQTILSNANGIGHPFLADNGSMVIYSVYRDRKGFTYVYDLERDQQYRVGATLRGQLYSGNTWLTAQSTDQCSVTSLQFTDEDLVEGTDIHVKKTGFWPTSTCASTIRTDNGDHYAKHYTFELETKKVVNIWLKSINKTGAGASHLTLTKGNTGTGEVITTTEDRIDEPQAGVLITKLLEPGQYTIEATSAYRFLEDVYFQLEIATDDVSTDESFDDCSVETVGEGYFSYDEYTNYTSIMNETVNGALKFGETENCRSLSESSHYPKYTRYYSFSLSNDHVVDIAAIVDNDTYGFGENSDAGSIVPSIKIIKGDSIDGTILAEGSRTLTSPLLSKGSYTVAVEVSQLGFFQRELSVSFEAVSLYKITSCPAIELEVGQLSSALGSFYAGCKSGTDYTREFTFTLADSRYVSIGAASYYGDIGSVRLLNIDSNELIWESSVSRSNLSWSDTLNAGDYLVTVVAYETQPDRLAPGSLTNAVISLMAVDPVEADCTISETIEEGQTINSAFAVGESCSTDGINRSRTFTFTLDKAKKVRLAGSFNQTDYDDYIGGSSIHSSYKESFAMTLLGGGTTNNNVISTSLEYDSNAFFINATLDPGTYTAIVSLTLPEYYPQRFDLSLDAVVCNPRDIALNTPIGPRIAECYNSDFDDIDTAAYDEEYIFELTEQQQVIINHTNSYYGVKLFLGKGDNKVALDTPLHLPVTLDAGIYTVATSGNHQGIKDSYTTNTFIVNTDPRCDLMDLTTGARITDQLEAKTDDFHGCFSGARASYKYETVREANYYRFEVEEAQKVTVEVAGRFAPEIVFYKEDGTLLQGTAYETSSYSSKYRYFQPGTYIVEVTTGLSRFSKYYGYDPERKSFEASIMGE